MIRRIIKFSALAVAAAMMVIGCTYEELSTDQFSDKDVTLGAFSPNPVYRGGDITIVGSNLDQVTEVHVAGVDPITVFTVEGSGRTSKLTFTVPVDGPEEGPIAIVTKAGQKIESVATLTYTEPVVFTSFTPASAMPGDVITIKGDYLNLVKEVIFEGAAYVTEFTSQSRYEIKLKVPANAITGRLVVGDSDEVKDPDTIANKVYSNNELSIGDPTVTSLSVASAKPGKSVVIAGNYLNMIQKVVFEGGVEVSDFTVSADTKTLTAVIPATAQTGDVNAISFAAKSFKAGTLTMVKPAGLSVNPSPVKAGETLTISGSDLDIVTSVSFPSASNAAFSLNSGKIEVTVPAVANEGDITLAMDNGDAVTVAFTLVHPTVTSVSPTELKAGETITVKGTDLDLVTKASLGGKDVELELKDDDIILTTSNTSVSGKIVLTLANGETVEPGETITLSYDSFIIVNDMPAAEHIGAMVTLKGENFMMIDRIFIGDAKVVFYSKRTDNEISFIMPYNKIGTYSIKFELLSGETEVCPVQIEVLLEQSFVTAWEGDLPISWDDNGKIAIPLTAFEGIKPGTVMRLYYSQTDQVWGQAQINYGNWTGINFTDPAGTVFNGALVPTDVYGWFSDGILDRCTEVVLTREILDNIQAYAGEFLGVVCGIIIQGSDLTFHKVELVSEIPQEKDIWVGSEDLGSWGNQPYFGAEGILAEMGAEAGQLIRIYFTTYADWWQIQLFDGHWGALALDELAGGQVVNPETAPGVTDCFEFVLNDALLAQLNDIQGWGGTLLAQGESAIITRIALF